MLEPWNSCVTRVLDYTPEARWESLGKFVFSPDELCVQKWTTVNFELREKVLSKNKEEHDR